MDFSFSKTYLPCLSPVKSQDQRPPRLQAGKTVSRRKKLGLLENSASVCEAGPCSEGMGSVMRRQEATACLTPLEGSSPET